MVYSILKWCFRFIHDQPLVGNSTIVLIFTFFYVNECFAFMSVLCACLEPHRAQKSELVSLEMEVLLGLSHTVLGIESGFSERATGIVNY